MDTSLVATQWCVKQQYRPANSVLSSVHTSRMLPNIVEMDAHVTGWHYDPVRACWSTAAYTPHASGITQTDADTQSTAERIP